MTGSETNDVFGWWHLLAGTAAAIVNQLDDSFDSRKDFIQSWAEPLVFGGSDYLAFVLEKGLNLKWLRILTFLSGSFQTLLLMLILWSNLIFWGILDCFHPQ